MSQDSFTETTHTGWFSRIGNSIKGVLLGIVLVIGSGILLFWNEGRSVTQAKTLKEGLAAVVTVPADSVNQANQGKLVHMMGDAKTEETLSDDDFGVSANALKLRRNVEMYQWKEDKTTETKKNVGGSTDEVTTYNYSKTWDSHVIDSSEFKKPTDHENPSQMAYPGQEYQAEKITVGAFRLSEGLIAQVDGYEDISADKTKLPEDLQGQVKPQGGGYYFGADPGSPKVGDLKIAFQMIKPGKVSLIAKQLGDSFEPYQSAAGGEIEMLSMGEHSAQNMFADAESMNTMITWGLRVLGYLLMFGGFAAILGPLSVLADVLPFLGTLVGMGTSFVAGVLAAGISLVIIAIAWFVYRPILAVALLVAAGGVFYLFRMRKKNTAPMAATPEAKKAA